MLVFYLDVAPRAFFHHKDILFVPSQHKLRVAVMTPKRLLERNASCIFLSMFDCLFYVRPSDCAVYSWSEGLSLGVKALGYQQKISML